TVVEEEMTTTLEALALRHATDAARRTAVAWSQRSGASELLARDSSLWSASDGFGPAIREGLGEWMGSIVDDVRGRAGRKRTVAIVAALGVNAVAVAVMLGVFAYTAGLTGAEVGIAAGTAVLNQKLLEAIFGEQAMAELISSARSRFVALLTTLFEAERRRFDGLVAEPGRMRELAAALRAEVAGMAPWASTAASTTSMTRSPPRIRSALQRPPPRRRATPYVRGSATRAAPMFWPWPGAPESASRPC